MQEKRVSLDALVGSVSMKELVQFRGMISLAVAVIWMLQDTTPR
jgi:hypothetical protein